REYLGGEAPEPAPQVSGDLGQYVTTREMFDKYARQMDRRDGELANKKFMHLMEKLSLMREDYAKLCRNLSENAASYSGKEVLTSFEAYLVDIENMLTDAGVTIGHFGSIGDPVDVQHQRIMGVVATDDPSKNGTVAQKLSEGYEYDGRAIVKEKVNVYKTAGQTPAVTETGFRLSPSQ
ncbi:MAG: nucleotide exchange factor GrpE, partial [Candidatus Methanomethylophilus sp.]|nr:nucleotide exchange factor GrpE [Methanomethylophilus sp.]